MASGHREYSARTDVDRWRRSLEGLFERADALDQGSAVAGDLNRYLCVRVAGYLEQSLISIGRSSIERLSGGVAEAFALSWLERSPNPSASEVARFVGRFSNRWREEFEEFMQADGRGQRLNALIGIRNDVAHGKNQGVSARQVRDYLDVGQDVVDWLLDRLEPKAGMAPASAPS